MPGRMVLVIEFDEPEDPTSQRLVEMLDEVRGIYSEHPDVRVHAAIKGTADEVLAIFDPEGR